MKQAALYDLCSSINVFLVNPSLIRGGCSALSRCRQSLRFFEVVSLQTANVEEGFKPFMPPILPSPSFHVTRLLALHFLVLLGGGGMEEVVPGCLHSSFFLVITRIDDLLFRMEASVVGTLLLPCMGLHA